jgi:hypothetical protein
MRFFSSLSHRVWFSTLVLGVSSAVSADSFDYPELVHSQLTLAAWG